MAGGIKVGLRGDTGGDSGPVVVDVVLECVSPLDAWPGRASLSWRETLSFRRAKTGRVEVIKDLLTTVNL